MSSATVAVRPAWGWVVELAPEIGNRLALDVLHAGAIRRLVRAHFVALQKLADVSSVVTSRRRQSMTESPRRMSRIASRSARVNSSSAFNRSLGSREASFMGTRVRRHLSVQPSTALPPPPTRPPASRAPAPRLGRARVRTSTRTRSATSKASLPRAAGAHRRDPPCVAASARPRARTRRSARG
jgi:hypothetical protein